MSYYQNLNLSNRPFRNRGLPWAVALVLGAGALIALFIIFSQNQRVTRDSAAIKRDLTALNEQTAQLRKQDQEIAQSLTLQQKRDWLAAHELINRKRFPWSRLFSDLEGLLPSTVRVNRISIRDIAAQGSDIVATFELAVQSVDPLVVNGLLERMQGGSAFQAEMINQTLLKSKDEKGLETSLRVRYRVRTGAPETNQTVATVQP